MEPRKIMELCKKRGYDVISITDHDSIKGSMEAKKYEREFEIEVIIGEERLTDAGDILGLYLTEEIKSRIWIEVLEEIKEQGGISVLPHPFRGHKNIENIANKVDLTEIKNSRSTVKDNRRATDLAVNFKKPSVIGSDAHVYSEIENTIMIFNDIFDSNKEHLFRYSKKYQKAFSYIIKDVKSHKFYRIPQHLLRVLF
jgi:predicted metal-dependent phosphoesterase TrpH